MQLNKPNTLGYLDPTNKEFYYKSKKGPRRKLCIIAKTSKTIWRVTRKLIIKRAILVLYWAFKYVVFTNLGRFQSIFRNLASCIWSETIQARSFTTKFKCQANSRDRARIKIIKDYRRSKVCKRTKIKSKARPNGLKNKNIYRTCTWTKIRTKIKIKVVEITFKIGWRGRVKFEIIP